MLKQSFLFPLGIPVLVLSYDVKSSCMGWSCPLTVRLAAPNKPFAESPLMCTTGFGTLCSTIPRISAKKLKRRFWSPDLCLFSFVLLQATCAELKDRTNSTVISQLPNVKYTNFILLEILDSLLHLLHLHVLTYFDHSLSSTTSGRLLPGPANRTPRISARRRPATISPSKGNRVKQQSRPHSLQASAAVVSATKASNQKNTHTVTYS